MGNVYKKLKVHSCSTLKSVQRGRRRLLHHDTTHSPEYIRKMAEKIIHYTRKTSINKTVSYEERDRFKDPNIEKKFLWKKKIESILKKKDVDLQMFTAQAERKKQDERMWEIESSRKRREESERSKKNFDEELKMTEKEKIKYEGEILDQKEKESHLINVKTRAEIRLRMGRPEPFDLIVKNLLLSEEFGMDPNPPFLTLSCLTLQKLEDIACNIDKFIEMVDDNHISDLEFWHNMAIVVKQEIEEAKRIDEKEHNKKMGISWIVEHKENNLYSHIDEKVKLLLQSKNFTELMALQTEISHQLELGLISDLDYWENIIKKLKFQQAKVRLEDIHSKSYSEFLKKRQIQKKCTQENTCDEYSHNYEQEKNTNFDQKSSGLSPILKPIDELDCFDIVVEEQDLQELRYLRSLVAYQAAEKHAKSFECSHDFFESCCLSTNKAFQIYSNARDTNLWITDKYKNETRSDSAIVESHSKFLGSVTKSGSPQLSKCYPNNITTGNTTLGNSITNEGNYELKEETYKLSQIYWWHEKYRPRKPKYFNRVHTGYEWNKYNQTHYDSENPPPKVVIGYKFNIFYPDLLDKSKTPQYFVENDTDSMDGRTCILRFHASPPYEDIAFKILNKQWETLTKKGYRCVYERGILHLYFNFTRLRYRR
jgi:hypothetical protein